MDAREFERRFIRLVMVAWQLPPVFGLGFLVLVVRMFTADQLFAMLLVPPLNLYIVAFIFAPLVYFRRFARPIADYLRGDGSAELALERARRFPLHFWGTLIPYLIVAPVMVMSSAILGSDFRPQVEDWFRIELVSLIVSIIVGLPIFFLVVDLFGKALGPAGIRRAHVTIRAKVFLIAALVPLLIDTTLVQYYWTVTGYFTTTTFAVWLVLEVLAVAGALVFVRSFQQSLRPLQAVVDARKSPGGEDGLVAASTDELGVLTEAYRKLVQGLEEQQEVLALQNRVLRAGREDRGDGVLSEILEVARDVSGANAVLLVGFERGTAEATVLAEVGVACAERNVVVAASELLKRTLDTRTTQVALDVGEDAIAAQPWWPAGAVAAVISPMLQRDQVIGLLIAAYGAPVGAPTRRRRELFEATAAEAAAVVRMDLLTRQRAELEQRLIATERLESIGRLAGGVAHDFNNILTAIVASCSLLQRRVPATAGASDYVDEIRSAAMRAAHLTKQLLAFSRQQNLNPEVINLNQVIMDIDTLLRRVLREDVALVTALSPELGRIRADRAQIEQVLMNLVVNARDALPAGGKISIQTRNSMAPGGVPWVECVVEDTGSGIPSDVLPHIFDPFFTTKPTGAGTGLGLATVHGIVAQSGGRIEVRSALGEGTTFTVRFPRAEGAAGETAIAIVQAPSVGNSSATVLLVEDDDALREVVAAMLKQEGFSVIAASSPREALRLADEHGESIDLMLSDVVMPEMHGPDLAREFRSLNREAKVVLMSGYADEQTISYVREAGLPLVNKPFTPERLVAAIRTALES